MKKIGLLAALAVTFIATASFAETITSVVAAYMTKANTTGADFNLLAKLDATAKWTLSSQSTMRVELLKSEVRVQSKADPNGEWINKLFLSTNDGVNGYYFNLTDRKIISLKSMKANDKLPNVIEIVVEAENGAEVEYTVTLLPTPREDGSSGSKVFHIIRLTDKSPVPTAVAVTPTAGNTRETSLRSLSPAELPANRAGKKP